MKIGDKVRFLSEAGGGHVAGFRPKGIVLVEDEDGFQVPVLESEVVVIGEEDYETTHMVKAKMNQHAPHSTHDATASATPAAPVKTKGGAAHMPMERRGGDKLSAYLAFVPINVKELSQTRFETYFVNDSNYYMRFIYLTCEDANLQLRATAEVEPNTKVFVEEFGREELNQISRVNVQIIAYKRDKPFLPKPPVDVQLRIDAVKFYKLHTFQPSDFFEQPALVYTIIEDDRPQRPLVINAQQLKEQMYGGQQGGDEERQPSPARTVRPDGPIVVDLHAEQLLDTLQGMDATDILNYQLDTFRKTLREHAKKPGTKVVFIHGKGNGVLRQALINELHYKFKRYTYQDASFQEYGYGATQVTIK